MGAGYVLVQARFRSPLPMLSGLSLRQFTLPLPHGANPGGGTMALSRQNGCVKRENILPHGELKAEDTYTQVSVMNKKSQKDRRAA